MQRATEGNAEGGGRKTEDDGVARLAMLVACASVLQVAESLFPHPLPGVRLGLANIITVIALVYMGPGVAIQLAVLRTLVSSMVLGTFLTPTFVLSFSGGVVSAVVMALLYRLSLGGRPLFSLVGISVGGAASHVMTQGALVYLLFIRSSGVLWLWPWLCLAAVATGLLTGLIAVQAVRRLEAGQGVKESGIQGFQCPDTRLLESSNPGIHSFVRRLRPELKIAGVVVLGLAVVFFSDWRLYAAVFGLLVILSVLGRVRVSRLLAGLKWVWPLVLASLVMPVVFSPWGRALLELGPLRVTSEGLHEGAVFAARILLLVFATAVLAQTTAPHELATGLEKLLRPLRVFRVEPGQLARSLSLSWSHFPQLQQSVRRMVGTNRGRRGWLDRTIHLPGDIIADMFRLAGQGADSAQGRG
ncbi:MAG TPA: Gx transporter family protein [bacterium]|nr:Gx transporter family protein [bacterium]